MDMRHILDLAVRITLSHLSSLSGPQCCTMALTPPRHCATLLVMRHGMLVQTYAKSDENWRNMIKVGKSTALLKPKSNGTESFCAKCLVWYGGNLRHIFIAPIATAPCATAQIPRTRRSQLLEY